MWSCRSCWVARSRQSTYELTNSNERRSRESSVLVNRLVLGAWSWRSSKDRLPVLLPPRAWQKLASCLVNGRKHDALRASWIGHFVYVLNSGACRLQRPWFAGATTFHIPVCKRTHPGVQRSCTPVAEWARAREEWADPRLCFFLAGIQIRFDCRSSRRALKAWLLSSTVLSGRTVRSEEVSNELERRDACGNNSLQPGSWCRSSFSSGTVPLASGQRLHGDRRTRVAR